MVSNPPALKIEIRDLYTVLLSQQTILGRLAFKGLVQSQCFFDVGWCHALQSDR